jgi:hypothetical protein
MMPRVAVEQRIAPLSCAQDIPFLRHKLRTDTHSSSG